VLDYAQQLRDLALSNIGHIYSCSRSDPEYSGFNMSFEALSTAALNDHLALFTLSPLASHIDVPIPPPASNFYHPLLVSHEAVLIDLSNSIVITNTRDALDALGLIRIRLTNRWLIL
jgi:hypothetical protein